MTKSEADKLRRRGATVPMIVVLLVGSAIIRIALGADAALAVASETTEEQMAETEMTCGPDDTPTALLDALQAREERVAEREAQMEARMQALRVAESEITEQLAALTEAEENLSALIALSDTAAETDLTRLTIVYENMKPEDAAALFDQMDPSFAAGFIGRMQPAAAAQIMANIEAETAHLISVILAGRNASAPTE